MRHTFHHPKGTFDLIPSTWDGHNWRSAAVWQRAEDALRRTSRLWGFEEVRTPIFESAALFERGVGAESDIAQKEMYTFSDRAGRVMALRPEGTLSIARAIIEHSAPPGQIQRLFYLGPMFRYERPQAGRYRQFHQFGVEAIGLNSPESDVDLLDLALSCCQSLGLQGVRLEINSLGDLEDRERFQSALISHLAPKKSQLSPESQRRLHSNPLRILDSKDPADQELLAGGPTLPELLSPQSKARFKQIVALLEALQIPHLINPRLVRGLDYYSHLVFELTHSQLGAQDSLGGGGRYDELFTMLQQPQRPALGFGLGMERMIQLLTASQPTSDEPSCDVYIIGIDRPLAVEHLALLRQLRRGGWSALLHEGGGRVGRALQIANGHRSRWALLVGEEEMRRHGVQCKDLKERTETFVPLEGILKHLGQNRTG